MFRRRYSDGRIESTSSRLWKTSYRVSSRRLKGPTRSANSSITPKRKVGFAPNTPPRIIADKKVAAAMWTVARFHRLDWELIDELPEGTNAGTLALHCGERKVVESVATRTK